MKAISRELNLRDTVLVTVALLLPMGTALAAPIELIQTLRIPGTARDGLVLTPAILEDGTPHDLVGGFGSAITWTGFEDLYLATPDRGPASGAASYKDRAYLLRLPVPPQPPTPPESRAADLRPMLLVNERGENFTGLSSAFDPTGSPASLRLDPEGVRLGAQGTFFVSDEYGPYIYQFDAKGERVQAIKVPDKFLINSPNTDGTLELPPGNTKGRQSNRGMEGLAISPDGGKLYGMMQNALIQDGALNGSNQRRGVHNRMLEIDIATGATREFVYVLDNRAYGVNALLAVNDHQFLAIERDGNIGVAAAFKSIYLFDTTGATDVSGIASLPQTAPLPPGVVPVTKTLFLNLLDPIFGLAGATFPEKVESLAFGHDLADGRRLLLVGVDNDFVQANDNIVWAFAIQPGLLPALVKQNLIPAIDIHPGKSPNRIHAGHKGEVPVAILGNGLFDATGVDRANVKLAGAPVRLKGKGTPDCKIDDVDQDGFDDLVCKVNQEQLLLTPADTRATLEARTTAGAPVRASDAVEVH